MGDKNEVRDKLLLRKKEAAEKKAKEEAKLIKEGLSAEEAKAVSSSSSSGGAVARNYDEESVMLKARLNEIKTTDWGKAVALMVKESIREGEFFYSGGEHPISRRIKMWGEFVVKHLITFMGVKNFRGFSFSNYSKKTDKTAKDIREMIVGLSLRVPGYDGKYSPIAVVVSFSDVSIAVQRALIDKNTHLGNSQFAEDIFMFDTINPIYGFLGSLASMYDEMEEDDTVEALFTYAIEYDKFQEWYINKRREAAKAQNKGKGAENGAINAARMKSRSYYILSLKTFSVETRRAWFNGNYDINVEKGTYAEDVYSKVAVKLAKAFNYNVEDLLNPKGGERQRK